MEEDSQESNPDTLRKSDVEEDVSSERKRHMKTKSLNAG